MAEEDETEGAVLDTTLLIDGKRGVTTVFSIIEFPPAIEECTVLWPRQQDYLRAIDLAVKLRLKGKPIGCTDIIIASMCLNRNLRLATKDRDFHAVQEAEKDFLCAVFD